MTSGSRFTVTHRPARGVFILLALLALLVVLARPICDLSRFQDVASHDGALASYSGENPSHDDGSEPCCASVEDGSLAVPATAVTGDAKSSAATLPTEISNAAWPAQVRWAAGQLIPPDHPPIWRSYHARSARILI